ncbi:MAG: hypothetical protein COY40_04645 [Alphaproteobacteria bacterium CG_4_10_14_0_8_um_filter_53_9]|nr:MAG: hypothetical protein COY40_04645 [Alphaproteobacteria bacterium CG_4_10_14_0_8_um_filter_53_9]
MSTTHTLSSSDVRRGAGLLTILSLIPHIFCCFLPGVAALMALGSTLGLAATLADNPFYTFVDTYHLWFLTIAIGSVMVSAVANFIAWRMDCHTPTVLNPDGCSHGDCTPKKRTSLRVFFISLAFLAVDISWFAFEQNMGFHGNHAEAASGDASHVHHH